MKVRIKFTKTGHMKFVGHLDTMRYFQKAIRRAGLPVAFSGGYSPHMIMSFAAPLGVGTTSLGEYFDMELTETIPTDEITARLNEVMVEGVHVISARQVEEGKAGKAMSLVAAADYFVQFREGKEPKCSWKERIPEFLEQPGSAAREGVWGARCAASGNMGRAIARREADGKSGTPRSE